MAPPHQIPEKKRVAPLFLALFSSLSLSLSGQVDLNRALSEGMAAYRSKDYNTAIEKLSAIVSAKPDGPGENVLYTLGFAYYFQLRHQDSADTFALYLKKHPDTANSHEVHLILGRALLQLDGKADEALGHLAKASEKPEFAEEARFLAADAYLKKGDTEKAAQTLKNAMKNKASGPSVLRASLELVDVYISDDKLDEAVEMLEKLEASAGYPDIIVTANNRFVRIGDLHLDSQSYADALEAYSSVRPRTQVIAIQLARLEQMRHLKEDFDKRIAAAAKAKQALPRGTEEKAATLAAMIENTDKVLGEIRTQEDYDATIQYRIGRCYFNMERFWPASVAFEAVADENPKSTDAPTALFGAIVSQWRLERPEAARKLCAAYLERFPKGKQFAQVAELNTTLLIQQGLNEEAIAFLRPFLEKNPEVPGRQKLLGLLANARFQAGAYDAAAADYDSLRKEFASSPEFEEYTYRRALCNFLRNDYEATTEAFDAYERDFPNGQFIPDIRYRRGIIQLALKDYDGLIKAMNSLLEDPAAEGFGGQIHTLLGDALSAKGDNEAAAGAYASAVKSANGDDNVIQYSLEQATNLLRGLRRWNELESLWKEFLKQNPKHPMALRAVSELSKLLVRANKKDEARQMLAGQVLGDIQNSRSEYVEMLISQLAGLHVPPRVVKKDAPQPDLDKIEGELVKELEVAEDNRTPVYLARVLFAKAELGRMMRDAARNERNLNAIANTANPDDLGPILLSMIGQFLLDDGQLDKAVPLFTRLRDAFPQSPFSDAAPVGLGRIALAKKEFPAALEQFDYALTRSVGGSMLKEATFGKALALKGLKKLEESKKLFEEIVSSKEWRGLEKAGSLFELGEIAAETGDKGAANAYFQRVYLSHGAYPQYAAKAYLRSAEMLKADGQSDAAQRTYRELVRNPKYADTPEVKVARAQLKE